MLAGIFDDMRLLAQAAFAKSLRHVKGIIRVACSLYKVPGKLQGSLPALEKSSLMFRRLSLGFLSLASRAC